MMMIKGILAGCVCEEANELIRPYWLIAILDGGELPYHYFVDHHHTLVCMRFKAQHQVNEILSH